MNCLTWTTARTPCFVYRNRRIVGCYGDDDVVVVTTWDGVVVDVVGVDLKVLQVFVLLLAERYRDRVVGVWACPCPERSVEQLVGTYYIVWDSSYDEAMATG